MLGFRLPFARRKGYGMGAAGGGNEGAAVLSDMLVFDQFTDTNGTLLNLHSIAPINIPATSWTNPGNVYTISGNTVVGTPDARPAMANLGLANNTVVLELTIVASLNAYHGVGTRIQDASNGWQAAISPGLDVFVIREITAGVPTIRATTGVTIGLSTYTITFSARDTTLTAILDGVTTLTYNSSSFQSATNVGPWLHEGSAIVKADNFKAYL